MKVKDTPPLSVMKVRADSDSLTSRAGTALLVGVADRVGLTGALEEALGDVRERRGRHRPGRILRDLAVMLADGGDCLCDLGALRDQEVLFGPVASDSTAWRLVAALDEEHLAKVRKARATPEGPCGHGLSRPNPAGDSLRRLRCRRLPGRHLGLRAGQ